ncbi:MAG: T9SS type A sorting domain-containing protein [bacterium]|nr:T9SS type A sorting domain-containing protein [bacterium]
MKKSPQPKSLLSAFLMLCILSFGNLSVAQTEILSVDPSSFNGSVGMISESFVANEIQNLGCNTVDVSFLGVEIDANSNSGTIVLGLYEGNQLIYQTGSLQVTGGVDELVGQSHVPGVTLQANTQYRVGIMSITTSGNIYVKTATSPTHLGFTGFASNTSEYNTITSFPNFPDPYLTTGTWNYNIAFRIDGALYSTNTSASISESACDSYTSPSGNYTWTSSGVYMDTIPNTEGCDSILTIDLTILNSTVTWEYATACDGYVWPVNGINYASSGVFTEYLTNQNGCDSVVKLDLTIHHSTSTSETVSACDSFTWAFNGVTYTSSGIYTDTLTSTYGCDSIATLDLTLGYSNGSVQTAQNCDSYTWATNGMTYTSSGTYTAVFTNTSGCDSTVTLELTINNSHEIIEEEIACDSFTWVVNGNTYTSSGVYTENFTTLNGCDSVHILNLTVNNTTYGVDVVTACDAYTWIDGNTYTSSNNTATYTLTNSVGCDSIVTLDLSMYFTQTAIETVTSCGPYTWIDGNTYMTSVSGPTHTITTSQGCDFIKTLDLTVLSPTVSEDVITSCVPVTWMDGNTYSASNNSATYILTNAAGCDSIVTLNLTINEVNTDVDLNGNVLTSLASNAQYQWMECAGDMIEIPGATNATYTASQDGDYAVRITQGQCVDYSDCKTVAVMNTGELANVSLTLYPNPSNGQFHISFNGELSAIEILDMTGRALQIPIDVANGDIDASALAPGKYLVRITTIYNETYIETAIVE